MTGTRAEYGLLYNLMKAIKDNVNLELQVVATGMHLSPEFGLTYKEIIKDGFTINKKIEMLVSADTPSAISKSTGLGIIGFADAFAELKPDIVILLGDRYETLAVACAAIFQRIPIGHISGGETTTGAFDEAIRHSITKMSWWHFVGANEYKNRVIQLGEDPKRVHLVGGMGVDYIKKTNLLKKHDLEKLLGFNFLKKNILVTFHPVTLENNKSEKQFLELLSSLKTLKNTLVIFTCPNSDTDNRVINQLIEKYVSKYSNNSISFTSMGQLNYISTLQYVDAVIGNSSSGLTEAPTFNIGTINIGDRQKGRLKADSVIDCLPKKESINNAIKKLYSKSFQKRLTFVKNPYGDGDATGKIMKILTNNPMPNDIKKVFYDL